MSIGNFPESLSQAILVGIILVGRLGVVRLASDAAEQPSDRRPASIPSVLGCGRERDLCRSWSREGEDMRANLRTKILDFRGFDSSRILILRGGILMSIGNFPEILSQRILVGIILVGRLGVFGAPRARIQGLFTGASPANRTCCGSCNLSVKEPHVNDFNEYSRTIIRGDPRLRFILLQRACSAVSSFRRYYQFLSHFKRAESERDSTKRIFLAPEGCAV